MHIPFFRKIAQMQEEHTVFGLLNTKTHFKCPSILRLEIINMVIVVYADANTFTIPRLVSELFKKC